MYEKVETQSSRVRAGLGHPVIDCDAHWIQPIPIFEGLHREGGGFVGGGRVDCEDVDGGVGMRRVLRSGASGGMSRSFWNFPADTSIGLRP